MVGFFGIPRNFMPSFARFCFAWRLFSYFNTPLITVVKDRFQQTKLDLVFIGGAFVHRREKILARLLVAYNTVAESGRRLTRSKLLAKRPHSEGHWLGTKLNNVEEDLGKTSGRPRTFRAAF